jgi:hypothetical protein
MGRRGPPVAEVHPPGASVIDNVAYIESFSA